MNNTTGEGNTFNIDKRSFLSAWRTPDPSLS